MRLFGFLVMLLVSSSAFAQSVALMSPFPARGAGVSTASATSAPVTTGMVTAPNSGPFPAPLDGLLTVEVQANAATGIYVCWFGGTCTAAAGEYLGPGGSRTANLGGRTVVPTMVSTGTPAVVVLW